MDVGQVQFSVTGDGLDATLEKAKQLETILNSIDKSVVGAKSSGVTNAAKKATKEAEKAQQNADKLEEKRYHNAEREINRLTREQKRASKEADRIEQQRYKNGQKWLDKEIKKRELATKEAALAPKKYRQEVETTLAKTGAQMQTFGAALQRFTEPFANVYRGLAMGVGYRLLGKVTESISGAFSRYDTMKTYSIVLEELGMNASKKFSVGMGKAKTAVDNLNDAVVGLPTGLDEIVASMRVYAGATGDVERATKLAIAANNAFIAGGMDDRQKMFTQRQLLSLAGGAELGSNQWDSLRRNAPLAIRAVAKEMNKGVQEMVDGLKDGTISGKEFLDTFISVGTEGKIANAAQKMKQTWDAVSQNMQNAIARAGEGILKTLDGVFEEMDGRSFLQHVLGVDKNGNYIGGGIRGVIDNMAEGAKAWIKANPKAITGFFDNISKINWSSIAGGFGKFTMSMGRFYSFLGRIAGNGTMVRFMLDLNFAGKAIQLLGGFTKGLALPLSWIKMMQKFGPTKKVAEGAGKLFKSPALVTASRGAAKAALTWQDVANKGLNIGSVMVVAKSIEIMSRAMQNFGSTKWDVNTIGNLGTATLALGGLTKFITGLGTVIGASKAGMIGAGVGTGVFFGVAKGIEAVGNAIGRVGEGLASGVGAVAKINTMTLPTPEKVAQVSKSIIELAKAFNDNKNPFENLTATIEAWTKGLRAGSIKKIADAMDSIERLSKVEISESAFENAKDNFGKIQEFAIDIVNLFDGEDSAVMGASSSAPRDSGMNGKKRGTPTYAEWQNKIRGYADTVKGLASALGYVDQIITTVDTLNKHYVDFGKRKNAPDLKRDWGIVKSRIKSISDVVYDLAAPEQNGVKSPLMKIREAADRLKGVEYGKITEAMNQIPKVIRLFDKIDQAMSNSGLFGGKFASPSQLDWGATTSPLLGITSANKSAGINFANRLKPIFDAISQISTMVPKNIDDFRGLKVINNAMKGIKNAVKNLSEISSLDTKGISLSNIQSLADRLTQAFDTLESVGNKEIKISFELGEITGGDEIVKAVEKEIDSMDKKIQAINGDIKKKIEVHLRNGGVFGGYGLVDAVRRRIDDIRRKIAGINGHISKSVSVSTTDSGGGGGSWHTGGKIKPLYRALGGYATRGTDTVHAMLTPGEYVLNRRAASTIGDNVLWKLNHMDIKGAISALSSRAGGTVHNTTNNKNIGGITVNNYDTPNVGFGRASRWVKSL